MVREFHRQSSSMASITPPPVLVRLQTAPKVLGEGDEMIFKLWFGPLPVKWHARIEDVSLDGFNDRMVYGPFQSWLHRHQFRQLNDQSIEIVDAIDAELKNGIVWRLIGWLMWINLPFLFAYRAWKTKRILKKDYS